MSVMDGVSSLSSLSSVSCSEVTAALPAMLDGGSPVSARVETHARTCLVCQAELARYRKLVRLLRQLRVAEVELPSGLVSDVLTAIENAASRRALRSLLAGRRVAYGALVLLAATGAAASTLVGLSHARGKPGQGLIVQPRHPGS
ncbi:MAG: anti-sigma factor family protein [Acidimicrobiales bacterium]